jgi:hypothetical protein
MGNEHIIKKDGKVVKHEVAVNGSIVLERKDLEVIN